MRIWQGFLASVLVAGLLFSAGGLVGAQESGMRVMRDVLATAIENRQPVEANGQITADVGQLFYFTDVQGGPGTIQHVWIWQGRTMATVTLEVKSSRFRTWSSKRIQPDWKGQWRVEARTSDGAVLSFKDFEIE
ncbi:MAG: DUF2914 domain-containing protein [Armatimonadetes bacterium]|nr:DUF2914 domain-containing protein [Armatimonadota bacterium]MBI2973939.1 DUF2914 domain-containing protein [Armatimonadota bacterium]